MKTNQKGIDLIKHFEGLRLKPYLDQKGLPTIGYGHKILKNESFTSITQDQAEEMLIKDLGAAEEGVSNLVETELNENQFSALVSFVFNFGATKLSTSTLRIKLNKGDYQGAAEEFSRWNHIGLDIEDGLTARREAEKQLFETEV